MQTRCLQNDEVISKQRMATQKICGSKKNGYRDWQRVWGICYDYTEILRAVWID